MRDHQPLVYLADDEPDLRAVLREALEGAGYRVVASPDGGALLREVEQRVPDLILLDLRMPGPSGWDVRRRLLERPETAEVPVIAVAAEGGPSLETSALRTLGFTDFVRKPFRLSELLDRVARGLERGPGRDRRGPG